MLKTLSGAAQRFLARALAAPPPHSSGAASRTQRIQTRRAQCGANFRDMTGSCLGTGASQAAPAHVLRPSLSASSCFPSTVRPLLRFPHFLQVGGTNREARNRARLPAPRTVWLTPPCGPTACSGPLCGSHLPPPRPPLPSPRTEVLCCLGFRLLNQTALAEHCLSTPPAGGSVLLPPDERPELLPSLLLGCLCDPRGLERGHEESLTLISISVMVTQCESCFVSETSGLNPHPLCLPGRCGAAAGSSVRTTRGEPRAGPRRPGKAIAPP